MFFRKFATGHSDEAGVQATQSMSRGEPEEDGHLLQKVVLVPSSVPLVGFSMSVFAKDAECGAVDNLTLS